MRDGGGVPGEVEAGVLECAACLEHAVARLLGAAGLRDDEHERLGETSLTDPGEHAVHAVGIGIVEERDAHRVIGGLQRGGDELRAEGGAADADHEHASEAVGAVGRADASLVDIGGEALDLSETVRDLAADVVVGGERRVAQPVVADLSFLVEVGHRSLLERVHRIESASRGLLHFLEEPGAELHAADVEPEPDRFVYGEVFAIAIPQEASVHGAFLRSLEPKPESSDGGARQSSERAISRSVDGGLRCGCDGRGVGGGGPLGY